MAVTTVPLESTGSTPRSAALTSRAAAEPYLGGVCFKVGPPELVGAELEWLAYRADADCREPDRPTLTAFAAALGPRAPTSIDPAALGLPLGHGSLVSFEPGGQVEISSQPCPDPEELCRRFAQTPGNCASCSMRRASTSSRLRPIRPAPPSGSCSYRATARWNATSPRSARSAS